MCRQASGLLVQVIHNIQGYISSEHISGIDDNRIGNSSESARGAGQYLYVSYDSGMIGDNYQTKTLTIHC